MLIQHLYFLGFLEILGPVYDVERKRSIDYFYCIQKQNWYEPTFTVDMADYKT